MAWPKNSSSRIPSRSCAISSRPAASATRWRRLSPRSTGRLSARRPASCTTCPIRCLSTGVQQIRLYLACVHRSVGAAPWRRHEAGRAGGRASALDRLHQGRAALIRCRRAGLPAPRLPASQRDAAGSLGQSAEPASLDLAQRIRSNRFHVAMSRERSRERPAGRGPCRMRCVCRQHDRKVRPTPRR